MSPIPLGNSLILTNRVGTGLYNTVSGIQLMLGLSDALLASFYSLSLSCDWLAKSLAGQQYTDTAHSNGGGGGSGVL